VESRLPRGKAITPDSEGKPNPGATNWRSPVRTSTRQLPSGPSVGSSNSITLGGLGRARAVAAEPVSRPPQRHGQALQQHDPYAPQGPYEYGTFPDEYGAFYDALAPYGSWFDEACDALEAAYPQFHDAIEKVVDTYLAHRTGREETFLAAYRRLGAAPFKEALYGSEAKAA
jgi:hypothetical protein